MILQFFLGDVILTVYLKVYSSFYFFHQLIISWLFQRYLLLKPRSDLFSYSVFCCLCLAYMLFFNEEEAKQREWESENWFVSVESEHQYLYWQGRQSPTQGPGKHGNRPVLSTWNKAEKRWGMGHVTNERISEQKGGCLSMISCLCLGVFLSWDVLERSWNKSWDVSSGSSVIRSDLQTLCMEERSQNTADRRSCRNLPRHLGKTRVCVSVCVCRYKQKHACVPSTSSYFYSHQLFLCSLFLCFYVKFTSKVVKQRAHSSV